MGQYLYLIEERRKRERENTQRLREELLSKVNEAISALSQLISFKDAYIFGSISSPKLFSTHSDIDIAFYGLRNEDFFKAISFLSRSLGRDVDVIQLENHRLEEKIKIQGMRWKR